VNHDLDDLAPLLQRARAGERAAFEELFRRYSHGLRQAIGLRLDRRLQARLDVSDVLQDTFLEAVQRLPAYFQGPEVSFGLWLHWLARDRLLVLHRQHLGTAMRSVCRELPLLPADSSAQFLRGLGGAGPSPSQALGAVELAEQLRQALEQLDDDEREVILMRHFEHLANRDIAWLLGLSVSAAHKRYARALLRLRGILLNMGLSGA
jgi:RNA polymerase sigma-70 factor (ECF subfamily)